MMLVLVLCKYISDFIIIFFLLIIFRIFFVLIIEYFLDIWKKIYGKEIKINKNLWDIDSVGDEVEYLVCSNG